MTNPVPVSATSPNRRDREVGPVNQLIIVDTLPLVVIGDPNYPVFSGAIEVGSRT